MTTTEAIPRSYEEAVRTLARWHADPEQRDLEIFAFPDPAGSDVRLVEVSAEFPETGHVRPVTFGPSAEFPFRSSVVLVTRSEWQRILDGSLALPTGWDLATNQQIWPNGGA